MADIGMRKLIVIMIMLFMLVLVVVQADNSPPLPVNDPPINTQLLLPYDPYTPPFMPPYVGPGIPRNPFCTSMCSKKCWKKGTNRFAYMKCMGLCNLKCIGPMSDVVYDCTKNCLDSKSPNFNPDARNLDNFMTSCYVDCKNNN